MVNINHPSISIAPSNFYKGKFFYKDNSKNQMSGGLSELFNSFNAFFDNIGRVISEGLKAIVQTLGNVLSFINNFIGAVFGQVSWDVVSESLGEVFQSIGNLIAIINPIRLVYNILMDMPLTQHSFKELDRITGGFITNVTNVSDVTFRSMRGDPISTKELIKDAFTILQIYLIMSGPIGAGIGTMIGAWAGRELCKHQDQKEVCQAIFTVVGAAGGSYVGDQLSSSISSSATTALDPEKGFSDYLTSSAVDTGTKIIVNNAGKEAIRLCNDGKWLGNKECAALGLITSNYINATTGDKEIDWPTFLAQQAAIYGVSEMLANAFPKNSEERRSIVQYTDIISNTGGPLIPIEDDKKGNPGTLLLLASIGAALIMGGV